MGELPGMVEIVYLERPSYVDYIGICICENTSDVTPKIDVLDGRQMIQAHHLQVYCSPASFSSHDI